jgi:hypothetical protein
LGLANTFIPDTWDKGICMNKAAGFIAEAPKKSIIMRGVKDVRKTKKLYFI